MLRDVGNGRKMGDEKGKKNRGGGTVHFCDRDTDGIPYDAELAWQLERDKVGRRAYMKGLWM